MSDTGPVDSHSMGLEQLVASELGAEGIETVPAGSLPWLTVRGHLDSYVQRHAPASVLDTLSALHKNLGGDATLLAGKRTGTVRPDLIVVATGQVIEVDEVQHFTTAREVSLGHYPEGVSLGFSLDDYRILVHRHRSEADRAFAHKRSADFDFAGGRQAQRAYNDTLRDLLAPIFTGHPVVRVAVPTRDCARAVKECLAYIAT